MGLPIFEGIASMYKKFFNEVKNKTEKSFGLFGSASMK